MNSRDFAFSSVLGLKVCTTWLPPPSLLFFGLHVCDFKKRGGGAENSGCVLLLQRTQVGFPNKHIRWLTTNSSSKGTQLWPLLASQVSVLSYTGKTAAKSSRLRGKNTSSLLSIAVNTMTGGRNSMQELQVEIMNPAGILFAPMPCSPSLGCIPSPGGLTPAALGWTSYINYGNAADLPQANLMKGQFLSWVYMEVCKNLTKIDMLVMWLWSCWRDVLTF